MLNVLLWNLLLTSILAVILAVASRLPFLARRPAVTHTLWLLLLIKLVTPPLIDVPLLAPAEEVALDAEPLGTWAPVEVVDEPISEVSLPPVEATVAPRVFLLPLALTLSLSVTALLLIIHLARAVKLHRWLKRTSEESSLLMKHCEAVSANLDVRQTALLRLLLRAGTASQSVRGCVVDVRTTPMLWGYFRPAVVLPKELLDELTDEQLRCIVAHELAHYRRRDPWSNLFACIVKAVMWWNPVVWWAHREMRAAQELCCDAMAIGMGNRRCYATTLLAALEFIQVEPVVHHDLALSMGCKRSILRRFEMITDAKLSHRMSRWMLLIVIALAIPLVSIPVQGQPDDQPVTQPVATYNKEHHVGEHASAVILIAIIDTRPNAGANSDKQRVAWLADRTRNQKSLLSAGNNFRVGKKRATLKSLEKDAVWIVADGKRRKWKLGATFASLLDDKKDGDKKVEGREQPTPSEKKGQPLERTSVQVELIGDPESLIVRGDKESVKRIAELLERLNKDQPAKGQPTKAKPASDAKETKNNDAATLRTYALKEVDPQTVLAVLKTLLANTPGVRMDVDVKTNRLIVFGSKKHHTLVEETLKQLMPKVAGQNTTKLRFSFRNAPWQDVLKWYAEATGLSLTSTTSPPGTFNFSDNRNYSTMESLDLLNSVLLTKGYTLLRRDRMLFAIDLEEGIPTALVPRVKLEDLSTRGKFEYVNVMLSVGGRDAKKIQAEIRPLLSAGGRSVVLEQANKLVLTETTGIIAKIKEVIDAIPDDTAARRAR